MNDAKLSEAIRCFVIIAITTAALIAVDLIARAFFYEHAQQFATYLPLLIGSIVLCAMGMANSNRNKTNLSAGQANTAGNRRVRVTGPVK